MGNERKMITFPSGVAKASSALLPQRIKIDCFKWSSKSPAIRANLRYVISPQDMAEMRGNYQLDLPQGIYAWIQIGNNKTLGGKIRLKGTIIAWQKNEGHSEHATKLTSHLGMTESDIVKAGIFTISYAKRLVHWNLNSGTYYKSKGLDLEGAQLDVGLPLLEFKKENIRATSPELTAELIKRFSLMFSTQPKVGEKIVKTFKRAI